MSRALTWYWFHVQRSSFKPHVRGRMLNIEHHVKPLQPSLFCYGYWWITVGLFAPELTVPILFEDEADLTISRVLAKLGISDTAVKSMISYMISSHKLSSMCGHCYFLHIPLNWKGCIITPKTFRNGLWIPHKAEPWPCWISSRPSEFSGATHSEVP